MKRGFVAQEVFKVLLGQFWELIRVLIRLVLFFHNILLFLKCRIGVCASRPSIDALCPANDGFGGENDLVHRGRTGALAKPLLTDI